MAQLINVSGRSDAVPIWGFHGPCTVHDVAKAVETIAAGLSGDGHVIHVMSGTHGFCSGQVGAVATREQKFAAEDRALAQPKTKDGKAVALSVHDFNTSKIEGTDKVTAAMAKLNGDMRALTSDSSAKPSFLLAYCCSAGTQ